MMFSRQAITIINTPQRSPTVPGVFTKTSFLTGLQVDGTIISEVGDPELVPTWFGSVAGYSLRKSRIKPKTRPFTPYGGIQTFSGLSSPVVEVIPLPSVGSRVVLTPRLAPLLNSFLSKTYSWRSDMTVILHIPVPLGMSVLMRVYCPEIDASTKTRGIIWKPGSCQTLALHVGWDVDVPIIRRNEARKGCNGLTLAVETTEDNSSDQASTPYSMIVWWFPHNIEGYGWNEPGSSGVTAPESWQFQPVDPPPTESSIPIWGEEQMMEDSNTEVTPGGLGDAAEPGSSLVGTPSLEEPTSTEATIPKEIGQPAEHKAPKVPDQTSSLNQKWHKLTSLTFAFENEVGTFKEVRVIPSTISGKGEGLFRPFRRNVFCAPSRKGDQLRGLEFKIVSNRAPSFAGVIQVRTVTTSRFSSGDVYYHTVGGEPTIFSDYGHPFVAESNSGSDQRAIISPWRKASTWSSSFDVRLLCLNYIQERTSLTITIFVRPGGMRFSVPIKPKARPNAGSQAIMDGMRASIDRISQALFRLHQEDEEPIQAQEQMMEDPATEGESAEIAPTGTSSGYAGLAEPIPVNAEDSGDLSQDIYWVRIGDVLLQENTPTGVTLRLPAVIDVNGAGDENTITERFSRFTDITPTRQGLYGPVAGKWAVKLRPPANMTFDIESVCLPPELNEEAATRIFGLDSILSIAGSAINSLGGSLLGGAINTVGNALGGIIGGPVGGIVSNVLGGVLGGGTSSQEATTSETTPAPEKDAQLITGDINFSRFLEFFKSFDGSEDNEPAWPTLLLNLVNLLGSVALRADGIPATVYIRMDSVQCTRAAWERLNDLPAPKALHLSLPVDLEGFGIFMQDCGRSRKPQAAKLIRQCFTVLTSRRLDRTFRYDLTRLNQEPEASQDALAAVFTRLSRVNIRV